MTDRRVAEDKAEELAREIARIVWLDPDNSKAKPMIDKIAALLREHLGERDTAEIARKYRPTHPATFDLGLEFDCVANAILRAYGLEEVKR